MSKEIGNIRGLVFQHSPMNDLSQNGRTMSVFMSRFQAKNLGQIYVTDFPICFDRCNYSYRISESRMMKKAFRKDVSVGFEVFYDENSEEEYSGITFGADVNRFLSKPRIKCYVQLVREYFWKKRYWDTTSFNSWIQMVKPDFILLTSGPIPEEYNMIREIAKRLSLPLVLYVSDDYVTEPDYFFFGKKKYYREMKSAFLAAYQEAQLTISISERMQHHLQKSYGYNKGAYIVAMNAVDDIPRKISSHKKRTSLTITYMGNLGIGRLETIKKLAFALKDCSMHESKIEIYTGTSLSRNELREIEKYNNIVLHKPVFGEEKDRVIELSDVLLHVESFDKKYEKLLDTAMSTKTPELLQSGVPVLIIGPLYSATVSFFQKGRFGTVVSVDNNELYQEALQRLFDNDDIVVESKERAYEYFNENYTKEIIGRRVANAIYKIVNGEHQ